MSCNLENSPTDVYRPTESTATKKASPIVHPVSVANFCHVAIRGDAELPQLALLLLPQPLLRSDAKMMPIEWRLRLTEAQGAEDVGARRGILLLEYR